MNATKTLTELVLPSVLATLALASSTLASARIDFFDGDFTSDWTYSQVTAGSGGSGSMSVQGGHVVVSTHVNEDCGAIYAFAFKTTATYDPSSAGALAALHYSEDAKVIDGFGMGQATGPAIQQGGKLFVLPGFTTGADMNWHRMVAGSLTAVNFVEVLGGACPDYTDPDSHPDFSASGATMTFGYFRANSQIDDFPEYDIVAAIDNWSISLGPIIYVAMGDSYSSGEGVPEFFADSNVEGGNKCHRSMEAYAFKVGFRGVRLNTLNPERFLACSGAETWNMLPEALDGTSPRLAYGTEPPQLDKTYPAPPGTELIVTGDTDMVTLSAGGNDLGFVAILKKCFFASDCASDSYHPVDGSNASYRQIVAASIPEIGGRAANLYSVIKAQTQDNASVFVLGYPRLFDGNCTEHEGAVFSASERQWLDSVADAFNVQLAASAAASGVHFVPVIGAFRGHGVCSAERWINGILGPHYSWFHPTGEGQIMYAKALTSFMKERVAKGNPLKITGIPANPGASFAASSSGAPEAPLDVMPSLGDLYVQPSGVVPCSGTEVAYVPGQAIEVSGGGYGAGQTVTLRLEASGYSSTFATASADSTGRLDAIVSLPGDVPTSADAALIAEGTGAVGEIRQLADRIRTSTSFGSDADGDTIPDPCDNCPAVATIDNSDSDADALGDACDACPDDFENDVDGDGLCAAADSCPYDAENDADGDAFCEADDNCPTLSNPSQLDSDSDDHGNACDAGPLDPGVWAAPSEVADLAFASKVTLTWTSGGIAAGPLTRHDLTRGGLAELSFEMFGPCIVSNTLETTATDVEVPTPGQGFWYVARARNSLGVGTYGYASSGNERIIFYGCP
jgi:hypothetical protein